MSRLSELILELVNPKYRPLFQKEYRETLPNRPLKKLFPGISKKLGKFLLESLYDEEVELSDLAVKATSEEELLPLYKKLFAYVRYRTLVTIFETEESALLMGKVKHGAALYEHLETLDLKHRPKIMVMGNEAHQNRDVRFYSDESVGYKYSGQIAKSKPLTPELAELLQEVNRDFRSGYNGILINRYNTGADNIGAHSDDEKALSNAGVVSLSLGATRKFRIRNKKTGKIVIDVPSGHRTILVMAGKFQKEFKHEIPKEAKVTEARYSLTFRHHLE